MLDPTSLATPWLRWVGRGESMRRRRSTRRTARACSRPFIAQTDRSSAQTDRPSIHHCQMSLAPGNATELTPLQNDRQQTNEKMKKLYTIPMLLVLLAPNVSNAASPLPWAALPTAWMASSTSSPVPSTSPHLQLNSMELNSQYYDLTVQGMSDLCEASPETCAVPGITAELERMKTREERGSIIFLGGLLVFIAGGTFGAVTLTTCHHEDSQCSTRSGKVMLVGVAGLVTSLVGCVYGNTSRSDLVGLLNRINKEHQDAPVHLQAGLIAPSVPGAAIAGTF